MEYYEERKQRKLNYLKSSETLKEDAEHEVCLITYLKNLNIITYFY